MMCNQMDNGQNEKYYLLGVEAMEQSGGQETVCRVYKECNPKKEKVVPGHDFSRHNMYMVRFGNCPLCFAGSKVIVITEEEVKP